MEKRTLANLGIETSLLGFGCMRFPQLPDGSIEPLTYEHLFSDSANLMHYGMTAPHGWEWFNPVREEERFKEYIERAKILMENEK